MYFKENSSTSNLQQLDLHYCLKFYRYDASKFVHFETKHPLKVSKYFKKVLKGSQRFHKCIKRSLNGSKAPLVF